MVLGIKKIVFSAVLLAVGVTLAAQQKTADQQQPPLCGQGHLSGSWRFHIVYVPLAVAILFQEFLDLLFRGLGQ